jgi:hypothetical protein
MTPLTARLDQVKEVAPGKWIARCPAHDDKGPSLSIRELDDGRTLIHCFAGCPPADVVAAVGLQLADLFPDRIDHHVAPARDRRHWHAMREAWRTLSGEVFVALVAAENLAAGKTLSDEDRQRLATAVVLIREAAEVLS